MYRNIEKSLLEWKNSKKRKPLLLSGARQTGKTYIIEKFAKEEYKDLIKINFEKEPEICVFFEKNINPKTIINNLEIYFNKRITAKDTLLFFDEIQACPAAITSLKYFCEEANQYNIIGAGSLLGVMINRKQKDKKFSFPVGKVDELKMFPMNFEEFLIALNENILLETIKDCYRKNKAMNELIHDKALKLYRDYITIGGMPEAVQTYLYCGSLVEATKVVNRIYDDYLADTSKYANTSEAIKNKECYDSIAKQLLKTNKNFKYSEVTKGKNAQYFNSAIEWLISSGIALKSKLIKETKLPLSFHTDDFLFRIYLSDVGLLRHKTNTKITNIQDISYKDDITGIIAENYVACELTSYNIPLYYWTGKEDSEIEFMVECNNNVTPLEVKAGKRVTSTSLNVYKRNNKVEYVYRTSQKNFGFENNIKSVPLYAVFCIAQELSKQI